MQEKLLFVLNMANACIYKVFLSTTCNKVSTPSLLLYSQILSSILSTTTTTTKMRYKNLFYLRGLFERFPPTYIPYSIALNGLSSPLSDLDLSHTNILKADLPNACTKA
jgi:hypothetical protein